MTRSPLDLLGRWRLDRDVDDRHADERLRVEGTLTLTRADGADGADGAGDRLAWREDGTLWRGERALEVHRDLAVELRDDGAWWVLFADGREFHPWSPGLEVAHPCGRDTYRGLVDVPADGDVAAWSVTWQVSGPAKDYTMRTRLARDLGDHDWDAVAGVRYSSTAPPVGAPSNIWPRSAVG